MSMKSMPSFVTLPVELIERILDLLDGKEILLSFGHVCRRFQSIAQNYNRLSLKFTSTLQIAHMQQICRDMRPENVVALTLDHWYNCFSPTIRQFLSSDYISHLTRLRSLTLCDIYEYDLQTIINSLKISTLTSLSLAMDKRRLLASDSIILLSALIAIPSLRQLTLDVHSRITDQISWSNQCSIHELRVQHCTYEQLCGILDQSPNLRIFALNECTIEKIDQSVERIPYRQLTSLTLYDAKMSIDELEFLLSLFPFLFCLKLQTKQPCSPYFLQRFCQWEHFIGEKLPLLEKFHFYVFAPKDNNENIESILAPFCTLFWLKQKQWFVTARYSKINCTPTITFYSPTHSAQKFPDNLDSNEISYSTTTSRNDGSSKMNNEWIARFDLFWMMRLTNNALQLPDQNIFRNLTQLALDISDQSLCDLLTHPSTSMNLSNLNEIWLFERPPCVLQPEIIENVLQQASNIRTLGISSNSDLLPRIENICSVISHRIDHFKIRVSELHCIKLALTYIKHLSTVTFQPYRYSSRSIPDMIKWLSKERRKFIVDQDSKSIQIWIDENDSYKRIKLTHHQDAS